MRTNAKTISPKKTIYCAVWLGPALIADIRHYFRQAVEALERGDRETFDRYVEQIAGRVSYVFDRAGFATDTTDIVIIRMTVARAKKCIERGGDVLRSWIIAHPDCFVLN